MGQQTPFASEGAVRTKLWRFEAQWRHRLTKRQEAALRRALGDDVAIGIDGMVADPWPEKWPSPDEGLVLLALLCKIVGSYRWRCAPYGRDCSDCDGVGVICSRVGDNAMSCDPIWRQDDWIEHCSNATDGVKHDE